MKTIECIFMKMALMARIFLTCSLVMFVFMFSFLHTKSDVKLENNAKSDERTISKLDARKVINDAANQRLRYNDIMYVKSEALRIEGFRVEESERVPSLAEGGIPELLGSSTTVLRIFGTGITENTVITFTQEARPFGGPCILPLTNIYQVEKGSVKHNTARVKVNIPYYENSNYYICAKNVPSLSRSRLTYKEVRADGGPFVHQGSYRWVQLRTYSPLFPQWVSILLTVLCLLCSALFSGLNLGLMSIDQTDLKLLCNTGTETEKRYARIIQPVRVHGNYLLCSLLLANVLVNCTFTILMDDMTTSVIAIVCSTIAIVLLGEITPQAICFRKGLAVGAHTIYFTKALMVITFPISYPVSKFLDCVLGEEIGAVYSRERLKELVKLSTEINDLSNDEVNIISGALELRKKFVTDAMTRLEDTFMLNIEAILDFDTVSQLMKSGFSRIPVFEGSQNNIITVLYIKDLAFVDPDDNTPLRTLCQFYQNPCNYVPGDMTLDVLFKLFKKGNKGHMAIVQRFNNENEGEPFFETLGVITLEDVIEELIQCEIVDETDVFTDNRLKRRRTMQRGFKQDFTVFADHDHRMHISPQLMLATFQYLSASVDAFNPELISETILRRLLNQNIVHSVKYKSNENKMEEIYIYQQGLPADFFTLILEGRVEVILGRDNLVFESGPFTYFGIQALTLTGDPPVLPDSRKTCIRDVMSLTTFIPDYTIRASADVTYIVIRRSLYFAAKRATLMERLNRDAGIDMNEDEMDIVMEEKDQTEEEAHHAKGNHKATAMLKRFFSTKDNALGKPDDSYLSEQHPSAGSSSSHKKD